MMMIDVISNVRKTGGFTTKPNSHINKNEKYTDKYKKAALVLQKELGSRNKAAKQLGIAASLLSTFGQQQSEGRF
jgi:hypothetical protein